MDLDTTEIRASLEQRLARVEAVERRLSEELAAVNEEETLLRCKLELLGVVEATARDRELWRTMPVKEPTFDESSTGKAEAEMAEEPGELTLGSVVRHHPRAAALDSQANGKSLILKLWEAEARSIAQGHVPFPAGEERGDPEALPEHRGDMSG